MVAHIGKQTRLPEEHAKENIIGDANRKIPDIFYYSQPDRQRASDKSQILRN